jgi:hypothetical protein
MNPTAMKRIALVAPALVVAIMSVTYRVPVYVSRHHKMICSMVACWTY